MEISGQSLQPQEAPAPLIERGVEVEAIVAALRAAREARGRLVIFEGHAGIGLSRLLAEAARLAVADDMDALVARASEHEHDFPFGVALQLFEPCVAALPTAEARRLFAGAARPATGLVDPTRRRTLPSEAEHPTSLLHGLYWLTANLGARRPLLLTIDDAQWSDTASLRFLLYLTQRLSALPASIVLGVQLGDRASRPPLMVELAAHPAAELHRPAALSPRAVARMVREAYDSKAGEGKAHDGEGHDGEVHDSFAAACATVTQGNPLLVGELRRALRSEAIPPTAAGAEQVGQLGPLSVARVILRRLERLPLGSTALARAVAVLGDGAPLHHARELAALEPLLAGEAADALAAAEILTPGEPLSFVHPIVRTAIYNELPAAERARGHARAAALLAAEGAPLEPVAAHLLAGQPAREPSVVATLRAAAERALAQGAPGSAARYLRRALAEPPPRALRADILIELGQALACSGDAGAIECFEEAWELIEDPLGRAEAQLRIGHLLYAHGRHAAAAETFNRGLLELGDRDSELAGRLHAAQLTAARLNGHARGPMREQLLTLLHDLPDATPAKRMLLAHAAWERAQAGEPHDEVRRLAQRALADDMLLADEPAAGMAFQLAVSALIWSDDLHAAEQALTVALEQARRRGSALSFATVSQLRAEAALRAGRIGDALAEADSAQQGARLGSLAPLALARSVLVRALIERDELDAAAAALGDEVAAAAQPPDRAWLLAAEAELRMRQDDAQRALDLLLEAGRQQQSIGVANPAVLAWRSSAALAAHALGQHDRAVELADSELRLAAVFGTPRTLGIALRTAGLVLGGEPGLTLLRDAAAVLESSPAPLEHARALLALGAAIRRDGQRVASRDPLRQALDIAHRCGATALTERVRGELAAAGARPRRLVLVGLDALTSGERRAAELAAQGMTNREIAEALFVTVKTVEWHLRNAYTKLGIGSRRELVAALRKVAPPGEGQAA